MAAEERRAWILGGVAVLAYAVYGTLIATGASYRPVMLWTIGAAIVAGIVFHIASMVIWPDGANQKDQRDREIDQFGEYVGRSVIVFGAVGALVLALLESSYFWIANAIYLAFVLSAVLASTAKIFAYRKGFHPW